MIQQLKEILKSANSGYIIEFDENRMMNVKVDEYTPDAKFAYIEEYVQGSYRKEKFFNHKTTQLQIYFCKFSELHIDAEKREAIRKEIEREIVIPFMNSYNNNSSGLSVVNDWNYYATLPRFDANEVSIMLQFQVTETYCL